MEELPTAWQQLALPGLQVQLKDHHLTLQVVPVGKQIHLRK